MSLIRGDSRREPMYDSELAAWSLGVFKLLHQPFCSKSKTKNPTHCRLPPANSGLAGRWVQSSWQRTGGGNPFLSEMDLIFAMYKCPMWCVQ